MRERTLGSRYKADSAIWSSLLVEKKKQKKGKQLQLRRGVRVSFIIMRLKRDTQKQSLLFHTHTRQQQQKIIMYKNPFYLFSSTFFFHRQKKIRFFHQFFLINFFCVRKYLWIRRLLRARRERASDKYGHLHINRVLPSVAEPPRDTHAGGKWRGEREEHEEASYPPPLPPISSRRTQRKY